MSICEISAGSGVTCSLGAAGGGGAEVALQACNANSVSMAASFQLRQFLRVAMVVFLLSGGVLQQRTRFVFCSSLRFLGLRYLCF